MIPKLKGIKWGETRKTGPARKRWLRQAKKLLRSWLKKEQRIEQDDVRR